MDKDLINIENYNNDFLLLKSSNSEVLMNLGTWIFNSNYNFIREVIITEEEICVALSKSFVEVDIDKLRKGFDFKAGQNRKEHLLAVYFDDNKDWEGVSEMSGLSKEDYIRRLVDTTFTAKMFGFLPGFIYLDGLSEDLHIPRKSVPAKYVEANSIAIGGKYLGIYPQDSPGGWYVIGKTPQPILDISKLPPVSYNLGDSIKIKAIGEAEYHLLKSANLK